ncbi:MAG: GlsB/YeaQ/YmgE family stress response membrane protein, partial [Bacillota bacterium]
PYTVTGFNLTTILVATFGAVIVLFITSLIRR